MTINRTSRYYNGPLAQTKDKYTDTYVISVFRQFPTSKEVTYIEYTWKEADTLAKLAKEFGLGVKYWWEIMEINPEIMDPFTIEPGTIVRIPYGQ